MVGIYGPQRELGLRNGLSRMHPQSIYLQRKATVKNDRARPASARQDFKKGA